MKITIPIPVSVNQYLMTRRGRQIKTKETRKCEKQLKLLFSREALRQKWVMPTNPYQQIEIHYKFYFDKRNRDTNNYYKLPLDAIVKTGVIALDDNILTEHVDLLVYDRNNPRIEMEFIISDRIGLFDNTTHLDRFKKGCENCKHYRNEKCKILRECKEGLITENIIYDSSTIICKKEEQKIK